jgi:hypothetical protein
MVKRETKFNFNGHSDDLLVKKSTFVCIARKITRDKIIMSSTMGIAKSLHLVPEDIQKLLLDLGDHKNVTGH